MEHTREWRFSTVTDLRQWLLLNRDEIKEAGYEPEFQISITAGHPVPVMEGHADDTTLWTEHARDCLTIEQADGAHPMCGGACHAACCGAGEC